MVTVLPWVDVEPILVSGLPTVVNHLVATKSPPNQWVTGGPRQGFTRLRLGHFLGATGTQRHEFQWLAVQ